MKKLFISPVKITVVPGKNFLLTGCVCLFLHATVNAQQNPSSSANDLLSSMKKQMDTTAKKNSVPTHPSTANTSTGSITAKSLADKVNNTASTTSDKNSMINTSAENARPGGSSLNDMMQGSGKEATNTTGISSNTVNNIKLASNIPDNAEDYRELAQTYTAYHRMLYDYLWKSINELETRILNKDEKKEFQFDRMTITESLINTFSDIASNASETRLSSVDVTANFFLLPLNMLKDYYETEEYNRFISSKNSFADLFASQKEILKIKGIISEEETKKMLTTIIEITSAISVDKETVIQMLRKDLEAGIETLRKEKTSKATYLSFLRILFRHLEKKCNYRIVIEKNINSKESFTANETLSDLCNRQNSSKLDFLKYDVYVRIESSGSFESLSAGFKQILIDEANKIFHECAQFRIPCSLFDLMSSIDIRYKVLISQPHGIFDKDYYYSGTIAKAIIDKSPSNTILLFTKKDNNDLIILKSAGGNRLVFKDIDIYRDKQSGFGSGCTFDYFKFFEQQIFTLINDYKLFGYYSTN